MSALKVFKSRAAKLTFYAFALTCLFVATKDSSVSAAACTPPAQDYGTATYTTLNIATTGTYEVQARVKSADANANSFMLEIDGNTCLVMGDNSAISSSTWTWIDYKDGNTGTKATHNFTTTGNHTIKLIGREAGVKLDRVIFTMDANCVPSGTGDNCAEPPDDTPPTVSLTSPANGANVSGSVTVSANASDVESGIQKVQFYYGATLIGEDTSSPYSISWNTSGVANGSYSLTAKATNNEGLQSTSAIVAVTIGNTTPAFLPEDINQDGKVNLLDFSLLASKFGQTGASLGRADINADGKVNLLDFSLLASKFGQ